MGVHGPQERQHSTEDAEAVAPAGGRVAEGQVSADGDDIVGLRCSL